MSTLDVSTLLYYQLSSVGYNINLPNFNNGLVSSLILKDLKSNSNVNP
nr:MAG TPA: hypothetical protein [Bacteriophage sp.]